MEGGGYDAEFVEDLPDYLKCVICQLALRDPLLLEECEHHACSSCLADLQKDAIQRNIDLLCPGDDRIKVDPTKAVKDEETAEEVLKLKVTCVDGCEWEGELRKWKNHLKDCTVAKETEDSQKDAEKDLKEEVKDGQGSSRLLGMFLMVVVILIAVVACYLPFREHNYRSTDNFKEKLKKMQKDFPNQDKMIWNMLKNGGARHLTKVHEGNIKELTPLSYHIAGYAGGDATVDCFVSRLAKTFTVDHVQSINSERFTEEDDKGRLDNEIRSSLNDTKNFLAVKDINKLPFTVAQLFKSYTDEHNIFASYPQSLIILTTMLPFPYDPARKRNDDERKVGEYYRSEVWGGVHADLSASLWLRVGDGLILIREEHTCISDDDK